MYTLQNENEATEQRYYADPAKTNTIKKGAKLPKSLNLTKNRGRFCSITSENMIIHLLTYKSHVTAWIRISKGAP